MHRSYNAISHKRHDCVVILWSGFGQGVFISGKCNYMYFRI